MYLSVQQVARMIGVCEKTIYSYIKSGKLPAMRFGVKLWRIKQEDVEKLFHGK